LLTSYVEQGGFLVLTNSAHHLFRGRAGVANEDWPDANAVAGPFGISFGRVPFTTIRARAVGDHPLTQDLFRPGHDG